MIRPAKMASSMQLFVFGDQTTAFEQTLRALLHVKDNTALQAFFDQVHYSLRVEVSGLPAQQKAAFPRFTSLLDLLAAYTENPHNAALGLCLLTTAQLGQFIR
jgi:naphtho-gamma-pyrone polyketide synthase